jgi:hypothetical protein
VTRPYCPTCHGTGLCDPIGDCVQEVCDCGEDPRRCPVSGCACANPHHVRGAPGQSPAEVVAEREAALRRTYNPKGETMTMDASPGEHGARGGWVW